MGLCIRSFKHSSRYYGVKSFTPPFSGIHPPAIRGSNTLPELCHSFQRTTTATLVASSRKLALFRHIMFDASEFGTRSRVIIDADTSPRPRQGLTEFPRPRFWASTPSKHVMSRPHHLQHGHRVSCPAKGNQKRWGRQRGDTSN